MGRGRLEPEREQRHQGGAIGREDAGPIPKGGDRELVTRLLPSGRGDERVEGGGRLAGEPEGEGSGRFRRVVVHGAPVPHPATPVRRM
jgi:hypothetical protein